MWSKFTVARNYHAAVRLVYVPLILVLALAPRCARAHDAQPGLSALFPQSNEIGGWTLKQSPKIYTGNQVFDYMDGAGEIPRSYDLRDLASAKYARGNVTLEVVAFDMGSSENAYGYFSARAFLERSPGAQQRLITLENPAYLYGTVGILTLWKGRYTVIVQPDNGKADENSLIAFGRFVSHRIKEKGSLPLLMARLRPRGPGIGTVADSPRYLRGKAAFDTLLLFTPKDVFGGAAGAEAVAAEFTVAHTPTTLCIVRYADAGAATAAYGRFQQFLVGRKAIPGTTHLPNAVVAMMQRFKGVGAIAIGRYLGVVVDAQDARAAETGLLSLRTMLSKP